MDTTRRQMLRKLGLGAGMAYAAPLMTGLSVARASGASGASGISAPSGPEPVRQRRPAPARPEMVVILAPGQDAAALEQAGFAIIAQRDNASLARRTLRLRVPPGQTLAQANRRIAQLLPGALAANNALYRPDSLTCEGDDCAAQRMIGWAATDQDAAPRIGMIDTGVNPDHPSLQGQRLSVDQVDLEGRSAAGRRHGTAVAALLIGAPGGRTPGLLPRASLIAIEAFHSRADGAAADAFSLLDALDKLIAAKVQVINMSFSGPPNPVLRQIVAEAHRAGIGLVAAAGNGGPGAAPAFPAAWPEVIAVTAIDADRNPYRQAARGDHVALAAPGVNVWTAASIEGGRLRSGTSYAAPFVTAALAALMAQQGITARQAAGSLYACATDLGAPGRDAVFGHGLLGAPGGCDTGPGQIFSVSGE